MAWVKLDDQFPSHPKMVLAGGDAGWLHVCALCYCGQHLTDGVFPKEILSRLSDRKRPDVLAAKLVEVGAWYDLGDRYEVHDYLVHNPSREKVLAEREAAKNRRVNAGKRSGKRRASVGRASGDEPENVGNPGPSPSEEPNGSSSERDLLFDALVDVFGPATMRSRASHYGKCVTELLAHDVSPDEVRKRGRLVKARFDNPSPEALMKWWDALDGADTKAEAEPGPLLRERDGHLERFSPGTGWMRAS